MIIYHNILKRLADAGYSCYRIQKENLIPGSTLDRIRKGDPINTTTIDTICRLCKCQPVDLMSWKEDNNNS